MGWGFNPVKWVSSAVSSAVKIVTTNVAKRGGWKGVFSGSLKQFAISFAASLVLSAIYRKLAGKPKEPEALSFESEAVARKSLVRSPVAPRSIIYGEVRKSGAIVHAETLNDNKDLYLVIALCGHEVNAINSVFFNDTEISNSDLDSNGNVTSGTFNGKAQIVKHLGSTTQTVDTVLDGASSNWTSDHRLRGIAYLMIKLTYDTDVYPNGIPNVSAVIQGKKILNVSTSVTEYSNNPANVIYNYLISSNGLGAATTEIDLPSFQQAYSDCNDSITITGGTQNRYTCNGVIEVTKKPVEVLEELITSCAGTLVFQQGKFILKVGKAGSIVRTITDEDYAGDLKIITRPKRSSLYNRVKGTFVDAATNFSVKEFNTQESSTYQTSDGETISNEIVLPFTTNSVEAQRLALIVLKQSRQMMSMELVLKPEHLDLSVGDIIGITSTKLGFTNKKFSIQNYVLNDDLSVQIILVEYADSVYDFDASTEQVTLDTAAAISLPSATTVTTPSSITTSDSLIASSDGIVDVILEATVTPPTFAFIGQYELEYKKSTDSVFVSAGRSTSNTFQINGVGDGLTYNLRAKVINTVGVSSSYVTTDHLVIGATEPPSDVKELAVNINGKQLTLSWEKPVDLDLKETEIRHHKDTTGATWISSQTLTKVSRTSTAVTLPAKTGTYFAKHIDKLNNFSIGEKSVVTNINAIDGINYYSSFGETISNNTGVKDNVAVIRDGSVYYVVLGTINKFDDPSGSFEDNTKQFFDSGNALTNTVNQGFYYFSSTFDLGATNQVKLEPSFVSTAEDRDRIFDAIGISSNNATGFFDSEPSGFDGDVSSMADVILQVRTSNDNVNYAGWGDFNVSGEHYARYFQFRLKLNSGNNSANPMVSGLAVVVNVPDRTLKGNDILTSSGSKTITFDPRFIQGYSIAISSQNLNTGDYHTITSKTVNGFTINYFNSSGSAIDRTFDYQATGY